MSKHTPGPWEWGWSAKVGDFDKGVSIIAPDGRGLVAQVANMERDKGYTDDEPHIETQANARLIAVAPAMLAELREVVSLLAFLTSRHPNGGINKMLCDRTDKINEIFREVEAATD